jgi:hypothetical protein
MSVRALAAATIAGEGDLVDKFYCKVKRLFPHRNKTYPLTYSNNDTRIPPKQAHSLISGEEFNDRYKEKFELLVRPYLAEAAGDGFVQAGRNQASLAANNREENSFWGILQMCLISLVNEDGHRRRREHRDRHRRRRHEHRDRHRLRHEHRDRHRRWRHEHRDRHRLRDEWERIGAPKPRRMGRNGWVDLVFDKVFSKRGPKGLAAFFATWFTKRAMYATQLTIVDPMNQAFQLPSGKASTTLSGTTAR